MASKIDVSFQLDHEVAKVDAEGDTTATEVLELSQTGPRFANAAGSVDVQDLNRDTIFFMEAVPSPANYIKVGSTASGSSPSISADGSDANLDLLLNAKGTGVLETNAPINLNYAQVAPPFTVPVNGTGLVTNLNADLLDGFQAADLLDLGNSTGVLPISGGGTNNTAFTANEIVVADGTGSQLISSGFTTGDFALVGHNHDGVYAPVGHNHDTMYEPLDPTILRQADVIDNLTSTSTIYPLSANQGRILNDTKAPKHNPVFTGVVTADTITSSAGNDLVLLASAGQDVKILNDSSQGLLIDSSGNAEFSDDLTVQGDLIVQGNTTTINTTNLEVEDQFVEINKGTPIVDQDSGIHVKRTTVDASIIWDHTNSYWAAGLVGSEQKILLETDVIDNLTSLDTDRPLSARQGKTLQDNKADKVTGATNGNLAGLDGSGNLTDSGISAATVITDPQISLRGSHLLYVDRFNTGTYTADGSVLKPYKTIQAAYDAAPAASTILIAPGYYSENVTMSDGKAEVTLMGTITDTGDGTRIQGKVTINNPLGKVQMKNLRIQSPNNALPALDIVDGRLCVFEGVTVRHGTPGGTAPVLSVSGTSVEEITFLECSIFNDGLGGLIDGTSSRVVRFIECYTGPDFSIPATNNHIVFFQRCTGFGTITHAKGTLVIENSQITGLNSTASAPDLVVLTNSSLRLPNLTLGSISKTGSASYLIGNNDSNPNETYTGADLGYVRHAREDFYVKTGWLGVDNVKEALDSLKDDIDSLKFTQTYYVDPIDGDDVNGDGSINNALQTLQAAIDFDTVANKIIYLVRGDHSGSILVNNESRIFVEGIGTKEGYPVTLTGDNGTSAITINGTSNQIFFKNLKVIGDGAPALSVTDSDGQVSFDNVQLERTGAAGNVVEFSGNPENWYKFYNSTPVGAVDLGGIPLSQAKVEFIGNCSFDTQITIGHGNYNVLIKDATKLGKTTQTAGNLLMRNVQEIEPTLGVALESAATNLNYLHLHKVNFQRPDLTYGSITKTGTADWIIENTNTNVDRSTLTGSRSNYAEWAQDIDAGFTPTNYTPTTNNITSHLQAIDNSLSLSGAGNPAAIPDTIVRRDLSAGFAANIIEADRISAKSTADLLLTDGSENGLTIEDGGNGVFSHDLTVTGDLIVEGNTTTINTTNLEVEDQIIEINKASSIVDQDSGIHVKRTTIDASLIWDHSNSYWAAGLAGSEQKILLETDVVNDLVTGGTAVPLSAEQGKILQDNKANKVSGAVVGNFAGLDASGDLTDSGFGPSSFEPVDASILRTSDVIDNLTSTSVIYPLSANQGRILNDLKAPKNNPVFTGVVTADKIISSTGNDLELCASAGQGVIITDNAGEGLKIDDGGNATFSQNLTVDGDLVVSGTTTSINTVELEVEDPIIELNKSTTIVDQDSGLHVKRTTTDASLIWDHSNSYWAAGLAGSEVKILLETDVVDNLTSTSTILPLSANQGRILDETKANKEVPSAAGNIAGLDATGDLIDLGVGIGDIASDADLDLNGSKVYYVDKHRTNTYTQVGSYIRPFKTIAGALAVIPVDATILVSSGSYNENLILSSAHNGLTIRGEGGTFNGGNVIINGYVQFNDAEGVRFDDLILDYTVNDANPTVLITGNTNNGRHRFHNVSISRFHPTPASTIAVKVEGNLQDSILFDNCFIDGIFENSSVSTAFHRVRIEGVISDTMQLQSKTSNAVTYVQGCSKIDFVTHEDGIVYLSNINRIGVDGSGSSIVSTANLSSTSALIITESSLLQDDLSTYGKINKTGTCDWIIKDVNRDPDVDTLAGARAYYAAVAVDHGYSKSGWVGITNVKEALDDLQDNKADAGHSHTLLDNATPLAIPNTLVLRDANADFAADVVEVDQIKAKPSATLVLSDDSGNGLSVFDGGNAQFSHDLTIDGNFTVLGNTTTIDTTTLTVEDRNIEIGVATSPTDATADGGGITLKGTTDKTIEWIAGTGAWTFNQDLDLTSGNEFKINNTSVLNSTTLGSGVINSSLELVSGSLEFGTGGVKLLDDSGDLIVKRNDGATNANVTANQFTSTVTTGTAPLVVASTTLVDNLNADLLDGQEGTYYLDPVNFGYTKVGWVGVTNVKEALDDLRDDVDSISTTITNATPNAVPNTLVLRDANADFAADDIQADAIVAKTGASVKVTENGGLGMTIADTTGDATFDGTVQATQYTSTVSTGTAPLVVSSSTLVTNFNADLLDGLHASAFELADATILKQADVIDNLVSTSTIFPLSADQGRVLDELMNINGSHVLYVDQNKTGTFTEDGSVIKPYSTISAAITAAGTGYTIIVASGTYNEDVTITSSQDGLTLLGEGGGYAGSNLVINGKVTINAASDVRMNKVQVNNPGVNATDYALHIIGSGVEGLNFTDCTFRRLNNPFSETSVRVDAVISGACYFYNTQMIGAFDNNSTSASSFPIYVSGAASDSMKINNFNLSSATVVSDSARIGTVTHTNGKVILRNIGVVDKTGSNSVISPAADAAGVLLCITNTSLRQDDGTFGAINKTGDCDYCVIDVDHDSGIDTIGAGSTKIYGRYAEDILADYTPTNYTALATDDVQTHLAAIDSALGIAVSGTPLATLNTLVLRDSNADFAARYITAERLIAPTGQDLELFENGGTGLTIADSTGDATFDASVQAVQYTSTVLTGTAPMVVSSTTLVDNFNADLLDGQEGTYYLDPVNHPYTKVGWAGVTNVEEALDSIKDDFDILDSNAVLRDGSTPLTADWDAGAFDILASEFRARPGSSVKLVDNGLQGLTIANGGNATFSQDLTVTGDLIVSGSTTTINTVTLEVEDQNIELGKVVTPTDATANDGGITLLGTTDKTITWANDTNENWTSNQNWNLDLGRVYRINNVDVLSSTTLGSSVVSSSLTAVGTLTTGTWNANIISMEYGGTGANLTPDEGAIVYSGSSNMELLAANTTANHPLLSGANSAPFWAPYALPGSVSQGSLLYGSSTSQVSALPKSTTANQVLMNTGVNNNPKWDTLDAGDIEINTSIHTTTTVNQALDNAIVRTEILTYVAANGYITLTYEPATIDSIHIEIVSGGTQINWDCPGRAVAAVTANYWIGDVNKKRVYLDKTKIADGDTDPGITLGTLPSDGEKFIVVYNAKRET